MVKLTWFQVDNVIGPSSLVCTAGHKPRVPLARINYSKHRDERYVGHLLLPLPRNENPVTRNNSQKELRKQLEQQIENWFDRVEDNDE